MLFTKVLVMISAIIITFGACGQDVGNGENPVPTVQKLDADGGQVTDALADQWDEGSVLEGDLIHYFVKLKHNEGNDKWNVAGPEGKCRKDKHPGCLLFRVKQRGKITFYLKKDKAQCPDAKYVITRIELTTEAMNGSQAKGEFERPARPAMLPRWIEKNAFEDVDRKSGIVYDAPWDKASTQTTLINKNDHKDEIEGAENELSFWYKVTVTSCFEKNNRGERKTWTTDPRGDNEGLD